jgi:CheY-like chemotaxis protein
MKTILIVEDIELNIDLLTQILEDDYHREGWRAGSGAH